MFAKAIEIAAQFTRPIHTISRKFNGRSISPGAATLFFVNDEGYALTCKHVVEVLRNSEELKRKFNLFRSAKSKLKKNEDFKFNMAKLQEELKLKSGDLFQMKTTFVDSVDKLSSYTVHVHPTADLAIIKFNDFTKLHCTSFAVFKKEASEIKQGKSLCRLGFPFPEFTNFEYNKANGDIEWTNKGVKASPRFPIDGMVTRFLGDGTGGMAGIELSTPGLRGQSGGPLFDENGIVCGMQSRTKHLHLGFDIENKEIDVNGKKKKVNDYSFIHLGECVHVDVIKAFMREKNVKFQEA